MNLTELATHVCEQCGMNDAGDIAASKMFIQRRLEMIWQQQLWRVSLIEAVLTVNMDGTTNLDDTIWIPSRGTLVLPPDIDSVMGVRTNTHALNVASLESYYRNNSNLLDMQGDPTEFQILAPVIWEFTTLAKIYAFGATGSALNVSYSANGVTKTNSTLTPPTTPGTISVSALVIYSASSNNLSVTLAEKPGAPVLLVTTSGGYAVVDPILGTFNGTWAAVTGATGYRIYVLTTNFDASITTTTTDVASTVLSHVFQAGGRVGSVYLTTLNGSSESDLSNIISTPVWVAP